MKYFSILISAIYVHNRPHTEIEKINKLSELSLSFNSTTFCPSRARWSAYIPEHTSGSGWKLQILVLKVFNIAEEEI